MHCNRELFHVQWGILLDDEFIEAYQHEIISQCYNGITCQLYPHIFTYSADYPKTWVGTCSYQLNVCMDWLRQHRVLIATIQNMGVCPCPCCLIPKSKVHQIATERDMAQWMTLWYCDTKAWCNKVVAAHQLIYEREYVVHASQIEELLKSESLVPALVSTLFHNEIQSVTADNYG